MLLKRFRTGKIPKQLLIYLVEVIIIFLGITISFVFDQWRDEKRQRKELIELSESLLTDIDALKAKLTLDRDGSSRWISELDSLRMQRTSGKISERQLTWFFKMATGQFIFLFDPYSPTYMSAVGSGLIHELPDSIRNQLYDLYRVQLPYFQLLYDQQQQNITNFNNTTIIPADSFLFTNDSTSIQPDLNLLVKKVQQPVYGNFINQVIVTERIVYQWNQKSFETSTVLQNSLQKYMDEIGE